MIDLCRNPSSISKKKELQKETEVLIKGHPVKIISATPMPKGALDVQKELKEKFKVQTDVEQPKKKVSLKEASLCQKNKKKIGKKYSW